MILFSKNKKLADSSTNEHEQEYWTWRLFERSSMRRYEPRRLRKT